MARQSPAGFAFGMLLEIAAVVVIVSLLPRFDLRPKTSASEPLAQTNFVSAKNDERLELPAAVSETITFPTSTMPETPKPVTGSFATAPSTTRLAGHEVEGRLDRASQQLVNTIGTAAADLATDVMHAASRPQLPATTTMPANPFAPRADRPRYTPVSPPMLPPQPAHQATAPQPRRWVNY